MNNLLRIVIAYILDLILGDPCYPFHPVRIIGKLITFFEKIFYPLKSKRVGGLLLFISVTMIVMVPIFFISGMSYIVDIFLIYSFMATRSLAKEATKIYKALKNHDMINARKELSYIVSRETKDMNEQEIIRSTIESVAENITDAITAPLFYVFIGGLPLLTFYKTVSTLDSMVGYKNEKYMRFGTISARMDDIVNFIPARLTGFLLIPLAVFLTGNNFFESIRNVIKYRLFHESPNSAHGESAVAGGLGVRLGGTNVYFGKVSKKPYIGNKSRDFRIQDIKTTIHIMYGTSGISICLFACIQLLLCGGIPV